MARTEHLPIYKRGYELCLFLEQVVRGFSRYHKYGLGNELSALAANDVVVVSASPSLPPQAVTSMAKTASNISNLRIG